MNAVEIHSLSQPSYPQFGKYKVQVLKDFYVDKPFQQCQEHEFDPLKCYFIRTKLECDMTFAEELELQSFPFDCQDLSVIIKGNFLTGNHYVFLPEMRQSAFASIDSRFSVIGEWDVATALIEFANDGSSRTKSVSYPTITLRLKLMRKWKTYVVNIISLLFMLSGCSLSAFWLDYEQLGERMSLTLTLLLTSVAFSIVIGDKLPNVAYLTFTDKYILASYIFLISVLFETAVVGHLGEEGVDLDETFFAVFVILYVLIMGIMFSIYAFWLRREEKMKLVYSSDDIHKIVSETRPTLVFDYTHLKRTGERERILSCMAGGREKWGSWGGHHEPANGAKNRIATLRQVQTQYLQKQHEKTIAKEEEEQKEQDTKRAPYAE